jgi:hypothetical protein
VFERISVYGRQPFRAVLGKGVVAHESGVACPG